MKSLCYPEVHLTKFDKMVLDGEEWIIVTREAEDEFLFKKVDDGEPEAIHVDKIYRMMVRSDHVEFINEE